MDITFHKRRSVTVNRRKVEPGKGRKLTGNVDGDEGSLRAGKGGRQAKAINPKKFMKKMKSRARDSQLICNTSGSERSDDEDTI